MPRKCYLLGNLKIHVTVVGVMLRTYRECVQCSVGQVQIPLGRLGSYLQGGTLHGEPGKGYISAIRSNYYYSKFHKVTYIYICCIINISNDFNSLFFGEI